VLEGIIVMQVKGGKEVTLTPGETFYEGPDDVHVDLHGGSCFSQNGLSMRRIVLHAVLVTSLFYCH
jgi:hypothetical protein